jgi:hypothetical protein
MEHVGIVVDDLAAATELAFCNRIRLRDGLRQSVLPSTDWFTSRVPGYQPLSRGEPRNLQVLREHARKCEAKRQQTPALRSRLCALSGNDTACFAGILRDGSDGTRTPDLRRDRPREREDG